MNARKLDLHPDNYTGVYTVDNQEDWNVIQVPDKPYYTSEEIAGFFNISQSRVRQLRNATRVTGDKVGSVRLHTKGDLILIANYRKIKLDFYQETT